MKTIATRHVFISAALAALIAPASAQVELIAGWNFGQFISAGVPSTDGTTGNAIDQIPSNFSGSSSPLDSDSGPAHIGAGDPSTYASGSGVLSFSAWDFTGLGAMDVQVVESGSLSAINAEMVSGLFMYPGDPNNAHLRFTAGTVTDFTITLNTASFMDFDPTAFVQPNDFNMSLAMYKATGGTASIEWLLDGTPFATSSTSSANFVALNVDLPTSFYGRPSAVLTGRVTGDVVIDHLQINGTVIPEPSTYAALVAVAGLAVAATRRRRA